jgi:antitoxin component of MazEF toxin-antitoxin module
MGMVKKLSKTGTSYSVILDKTLMQLLSITPDSLLEVKTDGKSLILTPIEQSPLDESVQDPKFQACIGKLEAEVWGSL